MLIVLAAVIVIAGLVSLTRRDIAHCLYGVAMQNYLKALQKTSQSLSKKYHIKQKHSGPLVSLVDYELESKAQDKIISAILYESQTIPYGEVLHMANNSAKPQNQRSYQIMPSFEKIEGIDRQEHLR